jgi:hypothetical protein
MQHYETLVSQHAVFWNLINSASVVQPQHIDTEPRDPGEGVLIMVDDTYTPALGGLRNILLRRTKNSSKHKGVQ